MIDPIPYDLIVIGSGPAGQKAAVQGAKAGKRVALFERERTVGGACVRYGTIPSKALRERALEMVHNGTQGKEEPRGNQPSIEIASLLTRVEGVIKAHTIYMADQIERNGIDRYHGRACFLSDRLIQMMEPTGSTRTFRAETIVIATGSRPRLPDHIPVDHENILDSDSILSMIYLPRSLTVLGGGVIASEYASIFALLGVKVTMIDRADRPVRFLDQELTDCFLRVFEKMGGSYIGKKAVREVVWDGLSKVITTLEGGERIEGEKMLVALGRQANVADLHIDQAGLEATKRGLLEVDPFCRTKIPHIYAVGDVIGPPALASTGMEQGRRAVCHALGLDPGAPPETIPLGIFTIPEMASVGITEEEAHKQYGGALVGRARFDEIARGQISGVTEGLLKMVADPEGKRLLGVHIVGEGGTELIHIGQMGLLAGFEIGSFVDNIFNFPTLAEAYRVGALDIVKQRQQGLQKPRASSDESLVNQNQPVQATVSEPCAC